MTVADARKYAPGTHPTLPPPVPTEGAVHWIRTNLFGSATDTLLTLFCLYLLYLILPSTLNWMIFKASWAGDTRDSCQAGGACWVFVKIRIHQFIYGFYPQSELWRPNLAFAILVGVGALLFVPGVPKKPWIGGFLLVVYPVIAYFLLIGGSFGLKLVETTLWGGLLLTLVIAGVGIVASLPIGVVMALGRRSTMPIVRSFATAYIEFIRGVPLITILFMASVMLPLFFHEGVNFNKLLRALIGVSLFWGAYMAEVVRGGLQAIPKGQYEAAAAMGLGYWRMMILVILPQALKHVIPGIVNTFISLFKDTTLVLIIGMFDLLGIVQAAAADPKWLGYYVEGYVFAGILFWIFCFGMSQYSQRLERQLHTGR